MSSNTSSATTNENSSSNSSVSKQQQEATRMFHEKMKILNENFSRFVQSAYKRKPTADFVICNFELNFKINELRHRQ